MLSFQKVLDRAIERKGGEAALSSLLPDAMPAEHLVELADEYFLEEMTRSIFQSGFVWRVINNKWPQFREAFFDFDFGRLMNLSPEDWDNYMSDTRVVRYRAKLEAVRHNLWYVHETAIQHNGYGRFLAEWPSSDLVGLLLHQKKHGSRLGGNTGQYFLQRVGKDCFALTSDVVLGLKLQELEIADNPTSQKDLKNIQQAFNSWHDETGLPYIQLSMILAYSVGENRVGVMTEEPN